MAHRQRKEKNRKREISDFMVQFCSPEEESKNLELKSQLPKFENLVKTYITFAIGKQNLLKKFYDETPSFAQDSINC